MARGLTRADTEDPLLNVRLTATVAGLDTSITTASRSGGTYLCADVPPGTVTRRATKAGFTPTEVVVDHTAGDTTETSFTMTPRRETADAIERDLRNEARRVLENVRVKTDSAQIREEAVSTLQAALDVIQERMPETSFIIEGHTDAQGEEGYNEQLSKRRADAVVEWLRNEGVPADRLKPRGRGESDPIASNDTEEGRQENRRTEIIVENQEETAE